RRQVDIYNLRGLALIATTDLHVEAKHLDGHFRQFDQGLRVGGQLAINQSASGLTNRHELNMGSCVQEALNDRDVSGRVVQHQVCGEVTRQQVELGVDATNQSQFVTLRTYVGQTSQIKTDVDQDRINWIGWVGRISRLFYFDFADT